MWFGSSSHDQHWAIVANSNFAIYFRHWRNLTGQRLVSHTLTHGFLPVGRDVHFRQIISSNYLQLKNKKSWENLMKFCFRLLWWIILVSRDFKKLLTEHFQQTGTFVLKSWTDNLPKSAIKLTRGRSWSWARSRLVRMGKQKPACAGKKTGKKTQHFPPLTSALIWQGDVTTLLNPDTHTHTLTGFPFKPVSAP